MSVTLNLTHDGSYKVEVDDDLPDDEASVEEFYLTTLDAQKLQQQLVTELGGTKHPSTIASLNMAWEFIKDADKRNRQLRVGEHKLTSKKKIYWPAGPARLLMNYLLARQHARKWSYYLGTLQMRGYDVEHQRKRLEIARRDINNFFEECEIQIDLKNFADVEN